MAKSRVWRMNTKPMAMASNKMSDARSQTDILSECGLAKKAISKSKSVILQKKISDCNGDQKKLFKIVDTLLRLLVNYLL